MPYASLMRKREYERQYQRDRAAQAAQLFPVEAPSTEPSWWGWMVGTAR